MLLEIKFKMFDFLILILCTLLSTGRSIAPEAWPGLLDDGRIDQELHEADPYNQSAFATNGRAHTIPADPGRPRNDPVKRHQMMHGKGFHWAILTCDLRHSWARWLSSTLVSGWATGVHPVTITLVWCKSYNKSSEPSLFANIRWSRFVKVLYMPKKLESLDRKLVSYWMALNVPQFYNSPDTPLLLTEDDIVFTSDFRNHFTKLRSQIDSKLESQGNKLLPYMASLYIGGPALQPMELALKEYASKPHTWAPRTAWPNQAKFNIDVRQGPGVYVWGSQALFYSSQMVPAIRSHFAEAAKGLRPTSGATDIEVLNFIKDRFQCDNTTATLRMMRGIQQFKFSPMAKHKRVLSQTGGMRCATFLVLPSLVEHTGSYSGLTPGAAKTTSGNKMFHTAQNFPFVVEFPAQDAEATW